MEFRSYLNLKKVLKISEEKKLKFYLSKNFGSGYGLKRLNYSKAKVYTTSEKKESVKNIRQCLKFTSTDQWVFSFIQKNIIPQIKISGIKFQLIRDHWDVLYYKKGDYFEKHQDFNKYSSNNILTYSCLYSFTTVKRGGRTFLWLNKNKLIGLCGSRTKNSLSLFQNSLFHSGEQVLDGEKIVLKFDLLGFVIDDSIKEESIMKFMTSDNVLFYIPKSIIEKYKIQYFIALENFNIGKSLNIHQLSICSNKFSILYEFLMGSNMLSKERTEYLKDQLDYMCVLPKCQEIDAIWIRDIMDNKLLITSDPDVGFSFCQNFMNNSNYFPFLITMQHSKKFGKNNDKSFVLESFLISFPNGIPYMMTGYSKLFPIDYSDEEKTFETVHGDDITFYPKLYQFLKNIPDELNLSRYITNNYQFYSSNPIKLMDNLIANYILQTMRSYRDSRYYEKYVYIKEDTTEKLSSDCIDFPEFKKEDIREYLKIIDKFRDELFKIISDIKPEPHKHININVTESEYEESCNDRDCRGSTNTYSYYREYYFTSKVVLLKK